MKLVFDERALADLGAIFNWVAKDNPIAAKAVIERVFASTEHLASFPGMGQLGRDEGTYEWVVPRLPYILWSMKSIAHTIGSLSLRSCTAPATESMTAKAEPLRTNSAAPYRPSAS